MRQKIIKVGNSAAVTIPKKFLKKIGWKVGDEVLFEEKSEDNKFIVRDADIEEKPSGITPEFKQWLDDVSVKYKDAIKELANT